LVWSSRELRGFRGAGPNQKALGHCGLAQRLQRLNRCCGLPPNRKARRLYASVWKAWQAARLLRRWIERKPDTLRLDLEGATRLTACCALNFFRPALDLCWSPRLPVARRAAPPQLHVALPFAVRFSAKERSTGPFFPLVGGFARRGPPKRVCAAIPIGVRNDCGREFQKLSTHSRLVYPSKTPMRFFRRQSRPEVK
jgi:hypothetical protein